MKRINFTTVALLVYLLVIGFISWPGKNPQITFHEYWVIILITLGLIVLLRFVQIKRYKLREKRRKEEENASKK
ncbi:hypothetical protein [Parabacteroides pacaensis]|uniref:hypothetical protein n=1 Tax=Parabacteroides pacaensis TaxID=2086575 RepID=UPI000D0F4E5F|nr:hypothetical protein [Parabacteroides pacaensis]